MSGRVTKPQRGGAVCTVHAEAVIRWWGWLYEATDKAVWEWINRPRIGDVKPCSKAPVFKPRDHFRRDGQPKVKLTQAQAEHYAETHDDTDAYRCSVCQAWHTGHKIKWAA